MLNLFKSKKKKFRAQCELSKTPLEKESAYMVTTAQIISSKKFWDNVMTEPDTMTYTTAYFKSGDEVAANMRQMIFNKYGAQDKPWIVADSQMHLFDVDQGKAKSLADEWFDKEGQYAPEESKTSLANLGENAVEELRVYAVKEAGRKMVQL
ncbi:MAG: hypothetical protein NXI20_00935 [bacterium]|jgi:hypothetical protein|nr:hypothetical protein [bacterium]